MKIEALVKAILLKFWDPIGIVGEPMAQDEYDQYSLQLTGMLYRGTTEDQISEYLEKVVVERIGLGSNPEVSRDVAKRLLALSLPPLKRK